MMDGCSLSYFYWTIEYHPFTDIMLGRARTSGGNFHSWVNCPFKMLSEWNRNVY